MIHVTDAASRELRRLERQQGLQHSTLIVDVCSEGCLDLSYQLSFQEVVPDDYVVLSPSGTTSAAHSSTDIIIAIASAAQPYVSGLKIDYSEDLLGGGFRFHNPNAASACGCSHSFAIAESDAALSSTL